MKLSISSQFQIFMNKMGLDINDILQEAGINKVLWKETIELNKIVSTGVYWMYWIIKHLIKILFICPK
ncbi:hypothetical protein LBO01_01360 [Companilactobacillus paralimentarius]|uniref:Uncharacterized protein n=1 Tax=Companilactobacillus bobalius TaxID=2801451 RepID=A0A202FEZ8_9LACO|nr:hypothetical protein LKACC16343_00143 [Companilactobacillus bobalius]GEO57007.1 hypothetical protein LBO01_01360 [Companilactobacillus paralimentarius]